MKALVGAFNQEKALVGAFSVIVKPMDRFAALLLSSAWLLAATNEGGEATIRSPPSLRFHRTHHGPADKEEIYLIVTITDWENADLYKGS